MCMFWMLEVVLVGWKIIMDFVFLVCGEQVNWVFQIGDLFMGGFGSVMEEWGVFIVYVVVRIELQILDWVVEELQ